MVSTLSITRVGGQSFASMERWMSLQEDREKEVNLVEKSHDPDGRVQKLVENGQTSVPKTPSEELPDVE